MSLIVKGDHPPDSGQVQIPRAIGSDHGLHCAYRVISTHRHSKQNQKTNLETPVTYATASITTAVWILPEFASDWRRIVATREGVLGADTPWLLLFEGVFSGASSGSILNSHTSVSDIVTRQQKYRADASFLIEKTPTRRPVGAASAIQTVTAKSGGQRKHEDPPSNLVMTEIDTFSPLSSTHDNWCFPLLDRSTTSPTPLIY